MIRLAECPICHKAVPPATDPAASYAPFCSRRCKEVDLFRWCEGRYAIVESIDPDQLAKTSADDIAIDEDAESDYGSDE